MQQRAFARRLTKVHASDVRRQVASSCIQSRTEISGTSNRTSVVCCSSAYDAVDPVDFEECVSQMKAGIYDVARSCRSVAFLDYPPDDIELKVISKNEEFCKKAVAELDFENLEQPVKDVLAAYSADYFVVQRKQNEPLRDTIWHSQKTIRYGITRRRRYRRTPKHSRLQQRSVRGELPANVQHVNGMLAARSVRSAARLVTAKPLAQRGFAEAVDDLHLLEEATLLD